MAAMRPMKTSCVVAFGTAGAIGSSGRATGVSLMTTTAHGHAALMSAASISALACHRTFMLLSSGAHSRRNSRFLRAFIDRAATDNEPRGATTTAAARIRPRRAATTGNTAKIGDQRLLMYSRS